MKKVDAGDHVLVPVAGKNRKPCALCQILGLSSPYNTYRPGSSMLNKTGTWCPRCAVPLHSECIDRYHWQIRGGAEIASDSDTHREEAPNEGDSSHHEEELAEAKHQSSESSPETSPQTSPHPPPSKAQRKAPKKAQKEGKPHARDRPQRDRKPKKTYSP